MSEAVQKKPITFYVDDKELKDAFDVYAKKRGFKNAAYLAKAALYEYIRRRGLKDAPALVQQRLR